MVSLVWLYLFPLALALDSSHEDSTVFSEAPMTSASEALFNTLFESEMRSDEEAVSEDQQDNRHFWLDYFRDTDGTIKPRQPNTYPRVLSCPEFLLAVFEDIARENPGVEEIYDVVKDRIKNMSQFFKELLLEIFRTNISPGLSTSSSDHEGFHSTSSPEVEESHCNSEHEEGVCSSSPTNDDQYSTTISPDEILYSTISPEDAVYTTSNSDEVYSTVLPVDEGGFLAYDVDDSEVASTNNEVLESNSIDRSGTIVQLMEESEEDCDDSPLRAGSIRGVPGVHFPNYQEIPITSFSCVDKRTPGFYADLETGCQVFHVCWPHRRESFLCPIGTTFNQAILACDYWYSSNCSLAPHFFDVNPFQPEDSSTESMVDSILSSTESSHSGSEGSTSSVPELSNTEWIKVIKFLPIQVKIIECPSQSSTDASTSSEVTESTHNEEPSTSGPFKPIIKSKTYLKPTVNVDIASTLLKDILAVVEGVTRDATKFVNQISAQKANRKPILKTVDSIQASRKPTSKLYSKVVVEPVPKTIHQGHPMKLVKTKLQSSEQIPPLRMSDSVLKSIAAVSKVLDRNISPLTRYTIIKNFSAKSKH